MPLCGRCGVTYSTDAPDPCLGYIEGATFACCGHGDGNGYLCTDTPEAMGDAAVTFMERTGQHLASVAISTGHYNAHRADLGWEPIVARAEFYEETS